MRLVKVLAIVAVAGAIALASAPEVWAQCGTGPRFFASVGGGAAAAKTRVDPNVGAENAQNELGRFWDSANSDLGNNWGYTDPTSGALVLDPNDDPRTYNRCPSDNNNGDGTLAWWTVSQSTLRGFQGVIATAACETSTCPGADLTFLVEEWDANGPPGIGGTAYYVAARTDYDPAGVVGGRNWDLNQPLGLGVDGTVVPLREFPSLEPTSSSKVGNDTQLTVNIGRPGSAGAAVDMGDGTYPNPPSTADTDIIVSIDIYEHAGATDPGRERLADCGGGIGSCWTFKQSLPYNNAAIGNVNYVVDCGARTDDIWVAAGMTFEGGSNDVRSLLLGKATLVQCDPAIADPDLPIRPGARSRTLERRDETSRRGGR